ncbi:hypothetical protein BRE01_46000 [Brevibacillus reuszeri]|uniref:Amino acid permease n=1 Tax=Brevibacillus reuszeri TaxID=54915 RepID=A0ABQ0TSI8_9BACL|nr:amino acid permease [Brevibacillus reuszeri]MED1861566.1 amino acid permease [Brevibacillus reuszeri]GED70898.1 hypothetical protein BRE01_46000 [Brevibacillus reuszeri]
MRIARKKSLESIRNESEQSKLKKSLRAKDLALLGMGSVIGTGIFVATGQGAHMAGPGIILSFIITAIISGLCCLMYSELATMFPVSGSTYSYSYIAFGEFTAWIVGWDLILAYLINASAVGAGWSATFVGLLHSIGIDLPKALTVSRIADPQGFVDLPAICITLLVTYILFIGISESAKMNNLIVVIKVAVILLFIGLGVSHINLSNLQPMMPFGWTGIMSGAAIVFYAYTGFDSISTAAEESVNPARDVPLGLIICLGTVSALYIAVALVLTGMVPFNKINILEALPAALSSVGIHWGSDGYRFSNLNTDTHVESIKE